MRYQPIIKLKALFLLVSFSFNSAVGFACSVGVDMGFNSHHHHNGEEKQELEHHGHGKDHGHLKAEISDHHSHKHVHKQVGEINRSNTVVFNSPQDENCCKDFVVGFEKLDKQIVEKNLSKNCKTDFSPFIEATNFTLNKLVHTRPVIIPPKLPDHAPPDIRIFIQSFLI